MLTKPEKASSHDCGKGSLFSFACESLAMIFHLKLVETKEMTATSKDSKHTFSRKATRFCCNSSNLMASKMVEAE